MLEKCEHLREFLEVETAIIQKHIDEHKWFCHIASESEGVADFIEKYGWLIREFYCGYVCKDRKNCFLKDKNG